MFFCIHVHVCIFVQALAVSLQVLPPTFIFETDSLIGQELTKKASWAAGQQGQ